MWRVVNYVRSNRYNPSGIIGVVAIVVVSFNSFEIHGLRDTILVSALAGSVTSI